MRRAGLVTIVLLVAVLALAGGWRIQTSGRGRFDIIWGRRGISDGRFQKPRAMAIDDRDQIYIVDMTARIQVFDADGKFLRGWQTPAWKNGKPTGLSMDNEGRLLVADTHYFRVLVYSPEGELVQTIGGENGPNQGQFGLVTDVVQDKQGNFYISEYGEWDRIHKYTKDGQFIAEWGGHGTAPGQFLRPQNMAIDEQDRIWVCDACNHRIQVFDTSGRLLDCWGTHGREPGQLAYPYDIVLAGDYAYISEFGNHRVQKFTRDGKFVASWGRSGRGEGELSSPWALVRDSQGRFHVLDTLNHRVQRFMM